MGELFGSNLFHILVFVGGIASISSLFVGIWKYRKAYLALNAALSIFLSVLAAHSFFQYRALSSAEAAAARHREAARADAQALLSNLPYDLFLEPGNARGVAVAGLAYLERYKDLYPETLALAQETVRADIELARAEESSVDEAHRLQVAGETMKSCLRGLAGRE